MFISVTFRILSFRTLLFIPQKNRHQIFRKLCLYNSHSAKYPFPSSNPTILTSVFPWMTLTAPNHPISYPGQVLLPHTHNFCITLPLLPCDKKGIILAVGRGASCLNLFHLVHTVVCTSASAALSTLITWWNFMDSSPLYQLGSNKG